MSDSLREINLDLSNQDFSGKDLTKATFNLAYLPGTNLTGTIIAEADFAYTTAHGFTREQLYSTSSYKSMDLAGIGLSHNDLSGWNFAGQNLTNASLLSSKLENADLSGAVIVGVNLENTTAGGFNEQQLRSTASYQAKNLQGINLGRNDVSGWNLHEQDLSSATFHRSLLKGTNLSGANLTGAQLGRYSRETGLTVSADLTGANLPRANLMNADLSECNLSGADMSGADLTNAIMSGADISGADLTDAIMSGADLGWANLANANLAGSILANAKLRNADTRGAEGLNLTGATSSNAILPNGIIAGLDFARLIIGNDFDGLLIIRNDIGVPNPAPQDWLTPREPIPVTIQDHMTMTDGETLQLLFDADPWHSMISFQAGIPVQLGGTLELIFAKDVDLATQLGRAFHIFDWTGVNPTGQFQVASPYGWDLSNLYTTGEVTLTALVPGDFNADGIVDTADYTVWRDGLGATYTQADYDVWRAHFGQSAGIVSGSQAAQSPPRFAGPTVPEPSTLVLLMFAAAGWRPRPGPVS